MTAVLWFAFGAGVGAFVGVLIRGRRRYNSGVAAGQALTELAHGWKAVVMPEPRRSETWQLVNRNITPTRERPESPRQGGRR